MDLVSPYKPPRAALLALGQYAHAELLLQMKFYCANLQRDRVDMDVKALTWRDPVGNKDEVCPKLRLWTRPGHKE